jgi:hypothetical protein
LTSTGLSHLFHIYSIEKKQKEKEKNRKQDLTPVESVVGSIKLPFQLAVAASQPAAIVANLLPFETAAGIQPPFQTAVRGYFCQC